MLNVIKCEHYLFTRFVFIFFGYFYISVLSTTVGLVYIIGYSGVVIKCSMSQGKHEGVVGYFCLRASAVQINK